MLIGQSVLVPSTAVLYYTPWMPRQGDTVGVVVEVIKRSTTLHVDSSVTLETKNNEDSDLDASDVGIAIPLDTSANNVVTEATRTGLRELIRYKFSLKASSGTEWLHFRSNAPIWFPN